VIPADLLEATARRDRAILLAGLVIVTGLAWWHLAAMAASTGHAHHGARVVDGSPWSAAELGVAAAMWAVMMVGMMLPIVSPWLLALSRMARQRDVEAAPFPAVGGFLLGYAAVWVLYSFAAAAAQLALQRAALLSGEGLLTNRYLACALLAAAGLYQWTPLRDACLTHCRSPFAFFLSSWREGRWGAIWMGARHGLHCLGCCWVLMALAFVFGVMSLTWMAGLTAFLLVEKATSAGPWLGRLGGGVLLGGAAWLAVLAS